MIDAAANRAGEGARTLEDLARFTLDDRDLSERLKHLRHGLRTAVDTLAPNRLARLAARDTPGDVGTEVATEAEFDRSDVSAIAAAAGVRLTESLRTLEEAAKIQQPEAARVLERLRYEAYDVDRALSVALHRASAPQWRLCVLLTESLCKGRPWQAVAEQALEGGADCVQLREKDLGDAEHFARARWLVSVARPMGAAVVINDRVDMALAAQADAVHLGQHDLPVAEARRLAGPSLRIGVSTARIAEARAAIDAGADSLGLGPMFASTTKAKPTLAGPAYLRALLADARLARVPHLAISGIDATRAGELAAMGCRGVAVSSAVCGAADPASACRAILAAMDAANQTSRVTSSVKPAPPR